jgi:tripartite-type tricarboxylate transporter receptor subunit TctC
MPKAAESGRKQGGTMRVKLGQTIGAAAFLAAMLVGGAAEAAYYEGKTITVIVGNSPGGTLDTFARSFAPVWAKYIPGNPTIIVQNMPGGGGFKATNHLFEAAKPDGLTVYWGNWSPISQVLKDEALRARYNAFGFLGAVGDTRTIYARRDVVPGGLQSSADIAKASGFNAGGQGKANMPDLMMRVSLDLLGLKYNYVTGYPGGAETSAAMQQNEIQVSFTSIMSLRTRNADFIKSGDGIGLYYFVPVDETGAYKANPLITEIPPFPEVYRQVHGDLKPSGPAWDAYNWMSAMSGNITIIGFAPPGTNEEALRDLRKGYEGASQDDDFRAQTTKTFGMPFSFLSIEDGEAVLNALDHTSPEVAATLQKMIE